MFESKVDKEPDVLIRKITTELVPQVLALELQIDQQGFLPDVASSLELAEKYEQAQAFAIFEGRDVVGFGLYGVDQLSGSWKIFRLMIDKAHQGRGLGEKAMREIIRELRSLQGAEEILICYHGNNEPARQLYGKLGFIEYGFEEKENKVLACLSCQNF